MKIHTFLEDCNSPQCFYNRNKTNLLLAKIVRSAIVSGTGRLSEPLKNNDISILKIFDCIKSQECIKVLNHKPDESNKHLKSISLGPSYLEQQISKAIDKAVEQKLIPSAFVSYLRAEVGLDKEKKEKPKLTPRMKQLMASRKQIKEEIEKIQDLPNTHVPIELPPLRQSENFSCGATAIQMVSAYYGLNIRESDLIEKLGITSKAGVKLSKIQKIATDIGLETKRINMSYDSIIKTIKNKMPIIVAILREGKDYHHFVVTVGYYDGGLIFRDPAKMTYSYITKEEFEEKAFGSDNKYLALVLYLNKEPTYSTDGVEKI